MTACGGDTESDQSVGSVVDEMSGDGIAEGVAALSCLPMDRDGWVGSDALVGVVDQALLASDGEVIVALGTGPDGRIAAHRSADGLVWEPSEILPFHGGGGPLGLAGGPKGFVAVHGARPPVFSLDGVSWQWIDPGSLPRSSFSWLSGVFAGPDGFIVVGSDRDERGRFPNFVWYSDDGETWTETDLSIPDQGVAVTATEVGWAVLGLEYPELEPADVGEVRTSSDELDWIDSTSQVRVWTSPDGLDWTEQETDSSPPGRALVTYVGTAPLTVLGDAWLLVLNGAADDDPAPVSPTVWMSTDAGRSWSEHSIWDDPGREGFAVHDTAVTESRLLVAGYQDKPEAAGVEFVHHTSDGINWEHCWTDPLELLAIESFGDALLAVTGTGTVYVWNEPSS
jgi:hypothetical protein